MFNLSYPIWFSRASISETSSHLSKLFLDEPLTIDLFMIMLPKEIYCDDTREDLDSLESSQTLGITPTAPIHRPHTNTERNESESLFENYNDMDLASQASDGPEIEAAQRKLASTSSIVRLHDPTHPDDSVTDKGHLTFPTEGAERGEEIEKFHTSPFDTILSNRNHSIFPEGKEIIKTTRRKGTSYTSLVRIGELLGSGTSSPPPARVPVPGTTTATGIEPNNSKSPDDYQVLDTRKSSGSTDYGYHYTRKAFSMENSPSASIPLPRNFDKSINQSLSPLSRSLSGSESSIVLMRGDRGSEVRCLSPVFHIELGSPC